MQLLNGPRATARGLAHLLGRSPRAETPAPAAASDEAEEAAEEEAEEGNDPPQPEAAPAAETDSEDEEEMRRQAQAEGAAAERARIGAILGAPAAQANPAAAMELALNTTLSAGEAIAVLGKLGRPTQNLAARMAQAPDARLGDAPATEGNPLSPDETARAQAQANHALMRRLRGETA